MRGQVRVLHVTTVPMSLVFLKGQAAFMRRRGVELHALSSPGAELQAFGQGEEVPTWAVPMERRITPLRDLRALASIVRVMRRVRPDIVHAHTPKGGLLGMLGATLAGVRFRVYHMRGLPLLGAVGAKRWLLRFTEALSCRLAHRVLCVSRSVAEAAVAEGICPPGKLTVPANGSGQGVNAARFDPAALGPSAGADTRRRLGIPADATVIGFVGRLVRDKGIVELEQAWRGVRDLHPGAHLLLIGPAEGQDKVPADTLDRLRNDARVCIAGEDWNTPPLFAAMDVVALPTYREGFPNVVLEAAAMCLPVVATRVPGCVDAVEDGVTGTLVPVRDAGELARALAAYLADPDLRRRHGRAGRARVLVAFRPETVWEAVHREYAALLGLGDGAAPRALVAQP